MGVRFVLSKALRPFGLDVVKRKTRTSRSGRPSIMLVTLPKSGSMFLRKTLSQSLGLQDIDISPGYFPNDTLNLTAVFEFAKGGYVAQTHIDASAFNLSLMSQYCEYVVLHLRDPRGAVLSWTYHKDRPEVYENPELSLRNFPPEPPSYYSSMTFAQKMDWQIDNYLPRLVGWIDDWCKAIDSEACGNRVVISKHEELAGRDVEFVGELIAKLKFPANAMQIVLARKDMSNHFRRGLKDEWRTVMNPDQIENATNKIPHHLKERFDWT